MPTRAQPADAAHQSLSDLLSELDYDLTQARSLLMYMATAPQVRGGVPADCSAFVLTILKTNPQYAELGATTPDGTLFCNSTQNVPPVNVSDRLYFTRALSTHAFSLGEYHGSDTAIEPSLAFAYPIADDNGNLRGVVIAQLKLSWLIERIATINIPVTGEIILLDTHGAIFVRDPDAANWFGKNIANTPLGAVMLTKFRGAGEYAGADDTTRVYEFDTPQLSNKTLLVAVGIPK